jgi:nitrile hydratase subunit beta
MNGIHDMGGMHGFGPVQPGAGSDVEPLFHAPWERRALGLTLAMGGTGQWNIDQSRSARECLPAATYLTAGYYGIWLRGLEALMLARGLVTAEELVAGRSLRPAAPVARVLRAEAVAAALARGTSTERTAHSTAHFVIGQRVRACNQHPAGHTRLPRYVRGHVGTVQRVHGVHVFADRHAASPPGAPFDEAPQWLYAVGFEGAELWGADAEPGLLVVVDVWEPCLQPDPAAEA